MRADPDDLGARVHEARIALQRDPSPLAVPLADALLTVAATALTDRPTLSRVRELGRLVDAVERALGPAETEPAPTGGEYPALLGMLYG